MTTSLDRQLKTLREQIHYVDVSKKRDSLLFDEKEAKNIELESVLAIGQEGLHELIKMDSRFKQFESNLFSEQSLTFNRVLKTKEENDQLDQQITSFLQLQSNYFLLGSSHKALEWLIRRFRINEFNIDQIMSSIIPFHDSNIFAKFISILRFDFNKKWEFLEAIQTNKLNIPREFFVKICKRRPFFLEFLSETIITYEKNGCMSKTLISFFTALMLEVLSAFNSISTEFLRDVLPCLNFSLKSNHLDLQLGSFMILGNIASRAQLQDQVIELIFKSTLQNCRNSINASFTFLIVLFQKQKIKSLSPDTLKLLVSIPSLCDILLDLNSQQKSLDRILSILIKYLSRNCIESADCFTLLHQFITDLPMIEKYHPFIVNHLIEKEFLDRVKNEDSQVTVVDSTIETLIRLIDPAVVQEELDKLLETRQDQASHITLFISQVLMKKSVVSRSKSNTVYLQLQSPIPDERLQGLSKLSQMLESPDQDFTSISTSFQHSITMLLCDSDRKVASKAWSLPKVSEIVPFDDLISSAETALSFDSSKFSLDCKKKIAQLLLDLVDDGNDDDDSKDITQQQTVIKLFFKYLLFSSIASIIVPCCMKIDHPIVKGLNSTATTTEAIVSNLSDSITKNTKQCIPFIRDQFNVEDVETIGNDRAIVLLAISNSLSSIENESDYLEISGIIIDFANSFLTTTSYNSKSYDNLDSLLKEIQQLQDQEQEEEEEENDKEEILKNNILVYCLESIIQNYKSIKPTQILQQIQQQKLSQAVQQLQSLFRIIFLSDNSTIEFLIKAIVKKFFSSHLVLLKFLSQFWNSDEDSRVVLGSLNLSKCLLSSQSFISYLVNQPSIIISFLVLLTFTDKQIRITTSECIKEIYKKVKSGSTSSNGTKESYSFYSNASDSLIPSIYQSLLKHLVEYSDEFVLHQNYFKSYVSGLVSPSNNATLKIFQDDKDAEVVGRFLVSSSLLIENLDNRCQMISALQDIQQTYLLTILQEYLTQLLDKCEQSSPTWKESQILRVLLGMLSKPDILTSASLRKAGLFNLYIRSLSMSKQFKFESQGSNSTTFCVLEQALPGVTRPLLVSLPTKEQTSILETVMGHLFSESLSISEMARGVLLDQMNDATTMLPMLIPPKTKSTSEPIPIARYNALMEIIRINSAKIVNLVFLINPIFAILKRLENETQDAAEYCKQLTFSALTSISDYYIKGSQSNPSVKKELISCEKMFDVASVIGCVEKSENLQTNHNAFLLLSNLASLYPKKVFSQLDSIIRMIQFVLSNSEDNYSFMILQKFLSSLLPSLLEHGIDLTMIFKLFLDSFNTIPKNHRITLFVAVLKSINYKQLHVLFVLMLSKKINILRDINSKIDSNSNGDEKVRLLIPGDAPEPTPMDIEITAQVSKQENELASLIEFINQLIMEIPVPSMTVSITNLSQSLNLISVDSGSAVEDVEDESLKGEVKLFSSNTTKDNRLLQANMLEFIIDSLSNTSYLEKFSFDVTEDQRRSIEEQFLKTFENLLVLLKKATEYSAECTKQGTGKAKEKYLRKLLSSTHQCMDRINQLLSVEGFIQCVSQLLNHNDSNVRRKSLVIFNEKITIVKGQLTDAEIQLFLSLLDNFAKIIESTQEIETNKQTALLSFEILARNFSAAHPQKFLQQIPIIIKAMGHSNYQVVSSSLICIATLCGELQAKTIPYIPQFFPVLLNTLTGSYNKNVEDNETRTLLQISCISSLEMMLNKIAKFLSPYLPQLLNALLHPRLTSPTTVSNHANGTTNGTNGVVNGTNGHINTNSNTNNNNQLSNKLFNQVKKLLTLITKNIEFRLLLPAMNSAYEFAVQSENDQSLICLFDFVGDISANLGPKDVGLHHKAIFKFYLQSFEFRRRHRNRVKNVDKVEDHIISSFMTLVMKLNENLFKPLFIKILDWALNTPFGGENSVTSTPLQNNKKKKTTEDLESTSTTTKQQPDPNNTLFFYKFVNSLANNLKTIFVPYFGYFLDDSIKHLQTIFDNTPLPISSSASIFSTTSTTNNNLNNIDNSNNKRKKGNLDFNNDNQEEILCFVISAFEKCFVYDTDGFLDKQKFEQILPPLVNQLENQMGTVESYRNRVHRYIVPCITQLAATINQDLLWKHLNHSVLMKTRSIYSLVRFSALSVIHSLHKRMGEQLIILLPETIPFISELLEDSVPEIEQLCQNVVKTIELHLGADESISSYL
eukprot:gene4285-5360_t